MESWVKLRVRPSESSKVLIFALDESRFSVWIVTTREQPMLYREVSLFISAA